MIEPTAPIYSMVNKLFEEDCLECMKRIPNESIDMILCDLPYGMTQNGWDSYIPLDLLWEQYNRIIKPNGAIVLTSQGLFTAKLILSQPKMYKYKWVWEKSKPSNFLNAKKQPLRKHEDVCVFYKKQPTYHPQMKKGVPYDKGIRKDQLSGSYGDFLPVHVSSEGDRYPTDIIYIKTAECEGEVVHPTQKPVALGRYLIRTYTNEGDIVLDNTFGSGSFLVAALLEGRNFIGIEKNKDVALFKKKNIDYIDVAAKRLLKAYHSLDEETLQHIVKANLICEFERINSMPTRINSNERSCAIDLIVKINSFVQARDLTIKCAGGESTISTSSNRMFPDVVLYGNKDKSIILQGWELKMPDVPIEDETFIKDAQRKARALGLNSFLIWNFTYAVLYLRDENDKFYKVKQWNETSYIRTRDDVKTYSENWKSLLEQIILDINQYFLNGEFRSSTIGTAISNATITSIVQRNKDLVADTLRNAAVHDGEMAAYIDNWWYQVNTEYEYDENDPYKAYAKSLILNWSTRILFAHIIKKQQNCASKINEISFDLSPDDANQIFDSITQECDFFNIFAPVKYSEIITDIAWNDLVELSLFLKENGIETLDQSLLQDILEGSVNDYKRELHGQFTTPSELAYLLAKITVSDWSDNVLDCCCGTGTIAKAALQIKKDLMDSKAAVETVWASDISSYTLQVANVSLSSTDTINLANRIFQHNALTLQSGEIINITDPNTGCVMPLALPEFGAIISNLPFVAFESIDDNEKASILNIPFVNMLDGKSDLYCYIVLAISRILKPNGMVGVVLSNSWLGTKWGAKFIGAIRNVYSIKQVHISGKGRWFKQADIVATLLILQKKPSEDTGIQFFLWQKSLEELANDKDAERVLINSSHLKQEIDSSVVEVTSYSENDLQSVLNMNVAYNALFHKISWITAAKDKTISISDAFEVFRGSRRGWDSMFYPEEGQHNIEPQFLKKVLKNARSVDYLDAVADSAAFCCGLSIEELKSNGYTGALEWISKFEDQRNNVGKPLPQVLKKANMYWYELQDTEQAEIFTSMNPNQRLFFAKFDTPSFVNQRLIGLRHKTSYSDEELNHALLNSVFTMFYIEAVGFGRGLGVLDINSNSIAKCRMLNPKLVNQTDRDKIVSAFNKLKCREIKKVSEELCDPTREEFEKAVFNAFGLTAIYDNVKTSLLSMQETRATAREK